MNDRAILAKDAAIRPWRIQTDRVIADRLADARVHAQAGRMDDAERRLDELSLTLQEQLGDARAGFYRQSFTIHRPYLDPAVHDMQLQPNAAGELVARRTPILGRNHAQDIARAVTDSRAKLRLAARQKPPELHLQMWEAGEVTRLSSHVRRSLSDSQIAIHEVIGHLFVRTEFR